LLFLLIVITLALIFCGEIVEWAVEKKDVDITGREINLDDVYVNILAGVAHIQGLTFYEPDGVTEFITAEGITADIRPWNLFKKRIDVESVRLDRLMLNVSHTYREFNYDDLIERFMVDNDTMTAREEREPFGWGWSAANFHIDSCRMNYQNLVLESEITMVPFNLHIPWISSELDTFSMHSDLAFIKGGKVNLDIFTDPRTMRYDLDLDIERVPIDYLYLYLRDYLEVADFGGYINADVHATGSIRDLEDIVVTGTVGAEKLRLLDTDLDTVFALKESIIELDYFNNSVDSFDLGSVLVYSPYIRFEMYPEGDNITELIAFEYEEADSTIQGTSVSLPGREYFNVFVYIADYVSYAVHKYQNSSYRIDSVGIFDGRINFSDYTLDQDATFLLTNATLTGAGLSTANDRVSFDIGSDINKVGRFDAEWSFNPRDVLEMELEMVTKDFLVSFVSPYSFEYTAYPFTYGDALFEGTVKIQNRQISSSNHLFVEDMEVGRKGFADPPIKLPIRFAVSILKDLDGNIDLDVPVKGDIDDPKFVYWPAVFKVLKQTLVKIVSAPYRLFAGMFKVDEDDLKFIRWVYGQDVAEKDQIKRARSIAKVLNGKPELALTYTPVDNIEKEVDYIAMFAAKEQYYRDEVIDDLRSPLTGKDTIAIGQIAATDSLFYDYLKAQMPEEKLLSANEMARLIVGADSLHADVKQRIIKRDSIFRNLMLAGHEITPERIIRVPFDSIETKPDTFNLVGPVYFLGFKLDETVADSLQAIRNPDNQED